MSTTLPLPLAPADLPTCHRRGAEVEPGRYACDSGWLVVGPRGVRGEACRTMCPYVDRPGGPLRATAAARGPCAHLGDPTGELRACPTCSGTVRLKVRACAVHGTCTEGRRVDGLACCAGCREYAPAGTGVPGP